MKLFWDTNILVDLLMVRRPFYESASTILTLCEENDWEIIVSSLSVMNANFICCERGKMPQYMWEAKIMGLNNLVTICDLSSNNLLNSCNSGWKDYEDCVQHSCAIQNHCDCIITRNPKDFILSAIRVFEPDEFILNNQK